MQLPDLGTYRKFTFRSTLRSVMTFRYDDGSFAYDAGGGTWDVFPEDWLKDGAFEDAEEEEDDDDDDDEDEAPTVAFMTKDGVKHDTYVDENGVRMYVDYNKGEWLVMPKEWLVGGHVVEEDEEEANEEYGTLVAPDGTEYTTYDGTENVPAKFYLDEESGDWLKVPTAWLPAPRPGTSHSRRASVASMSLDESIGESATHLSPSKAGSGFAGSAATQANNKIMAEQKERIEDLERADKEQKQRIADLEAQLTRAKDNMNKSAGAAGERVQQLEEELDAAKDAAAIELASAKAKTADLEDEIAKLRFSGSEQLKRGLEEKDERIGKLTSELNATQVELHSVKHKLEHREGRTRKQLEALIGQLKALRPEFDDVKRMARDMTSEHPRIFKELGRVHEESQVMLGNMVNHIKAKYRAEMLQRKLIWNQLQNIKGNIRVFCRARGLNAREKAEGGKMCVRISADNNTELSVTDENGQRRDFEFDAVFGPNATQEDVFEDTEPLCVSVIDGYNVCIFAYGQTGAGKTYTMMGTPQARGVNVRALTELFKVTEDRKEDWEYKMSVSMLEIYNEQVRDLLVEAGEDGEFEALDIRSTPQGNVIPGLKEVPVAKMSDVERLIQISESNRTTAATAMNSASSRSHSVLQIKISGKNELSKMKTSGKLTLVDLAGSERVGKSEAKGQRLVEAAAINKSLSALGNCIHALQSGQSHVPYRDSKLTFLLQDSLGGDSKTMMFLNVSPATFNIDETLMSLKFGVRVRSVIVGPPGGKGKGKGGPKAKGKGKRRPPKKKKGKKGKAPPKAAAADEDDDEEEDDDDGDDDEDE